MSTQIEENYLKAIFRLSEGLTDEVPQPVSTSRLAKDLNVQSATATDMIQKLAQRKLVKYQKYRGVLLSDAGRKAAVAIVRKHRLWEVFLAEKLNFNWAEVHEVAEQLEHVKSELLTDRLESYLGYPKTDPHGDPIPDKKGQWRKSQTVLLSELSAGSKATVRAVAQDERTLLQHLQALGLVIGSVLEVLSKADFDGSMLLKLDQRQLSISDKIAENLLVEITTHL